MKRRRSPYLLRCSELAVAERIAEGKADKEIAWELRVCKQTVRAHIRNACERLGLPVDRVLLAGWWFRNVWVAEHGPCKNCLLRQAHELGDLNTPKAA